MKWGCVYASTTLIYNVDGLVKIGSTSKEKPDNRMEQLSAQQPQKFYALLWVNTISPKSAETLLHKYFAEYKYVGDGGVEWFKGIPRNELIKGFMHISNMYNALPIYPGFVYQNGKWVEETSLQKY